MRVIEEGKDRNRELQTELDDARKITEEAIALKESLEKRLGEMTTNQQILAGLIEVNKEKKATWEDKDADSAIREQILKDGQDKLDRGNEGLARRYVELGHEKDEHRLKVLKLLKSIKDKTRKGQLEELSKELEEDLKSEDITDINA